MSLRARTLCCDMFEVEEKMVWKVWSDWLLILVGDLTGKLQAMEKYDDRVIGIAAILLGCKLYVVCVSSFKRTLLPLATTCLCPPSLI